MHPQPPEIAELVQLLYRHPPEPTQLEITILPDRIQDGGDDNNYDQNDYYYLKDGIHLGIHAPNVPHLARLFRNEYYSWRTEFKKESVIKRKYNAINDTVTHVDEKKKKNDDATFLELQGRLWDATTCLVLLCPDHATAWSDRKRILLLRQELQLQRSRQGCPNVTSPNKGNDDSSRQKKHIELWQEEITFMNLLFTQYSKAPNSWAHRKWVSKQIFEVIQSSLYQRHNHHETNNIQINANTSPYTTTAKNNENDEKDDILNPESRITLISEWTQNELGICTSIAEKYPKNYYAWTHRRFVIDSLIQLDIAQKRNALSLPLEHQIEPDDCKRDCDKRSYLWQSLQSEYDFIQNWIMKHVSDHSAVHYGSEILRIMIFLSCREDEHFQQRDDHSTAICGRSGSFCHVYECRYFGPQAYMSNPLTPKEDGSTSHHHDLQSYHTTTNKSKGVPKYNKWKMDLLQKSLMKSQEFIQKYPTNEVVWIWRRVCFQIYMDYVLGIVERHVVSGTMEENTNEVFCNDATLKIEEKITSYDCEELIQKDIEAFVINDNLTLDDAYDQRRYKLYSSTYILWLFEHFRHHRNRGARGKTTVLNKVTDEKPSCDDSMNTILVTKWQKLWSKLVSDLAGDESNRGFTFSNMWIIKKEYWNAKA